MAIKKQNKNARIRQKWRASNADKIKIMRRSEKYKTTRNRWARQKYATDARYRIEILLRRSFSQCLARARVKKTTSAPKLIGCTADELLIHIEKQFLSRMSWNNFGEWEIDHIIPCAAFDLTNPDHQAVCFHFTNLRPLWKKANRSKNKFRELLV